MRDAGLGRCGAYLRLGLAAEGPRPAQRAVLGCCSIGTGALGDVETPAGHTGSGRSRAEEGKGGRSDRAGGHSAWC